MTKAMLPRLFMLLFIAFAGIYACSQRDDLDLEAALPHATVLTVVADAVTPAGLAGSAR